MTDPSSTPTMRAVVQTAYGDPERVLSLREIPRPRPAADEVLVRVHAASMHPDVWHVVRGVPAVLRLMGAGMRRPKQPIPGIDLAGTVEAVGADVTRFRPGQRVFGESVRGIQWQNGGAYAEYAVAPERNLAVVPEGIDLVRAAAVPTSGLIALSSLGTQRIRPGHRVLVNGAAGGVGLFAVQIAKAQGAEVTGVDRTEALGLMREVGCDHVIDYTREDFAQGEARYDLILDIPMNHPFRVARRALTPDGVYVMVGHGGYDARRGRWLDGVAQALLLTARGFFTTQLPKPTGSGLTKPEAMEVLRSLLADGSLTPVIDRTFALEEIVAALEYLASGRSNGKVMIVLEASSTRVQSDRGQSE